MLKDGWGRLSSDISCGAFDVVFLARKGPCSIDPECQGFDPICQSRQACTQQSVLNSTGVRSCPRLTVRVTALCPETSEGNAIAANCLRFSGQCRWSTTGLQVTGRPLGAMRARIGHGLLPDVHFAFGPTLQSAWRVDRPPFLDRRLDAVREVFRQIAEIARQGIATPSREGDHRGERRQDGHWNCGLRARTCREPREDARAPICKTGKGSRRCGQPMYSARSRGRSAISLKPLLFRLHTIGFQIGGPCPGFAPPLRIGRANQARTPRHAVTGHPVRSRIVRATG